MSMKFLIDTHCWLWWFLDSKKVGPATRKLISNPKNSVVVSAASVWEISIKASMGKLRLPESAKKYIPSCLSGQGMDFLPIQLAHVLQVAELPFHHHDPFDRLLIAQAQVERIPILTADSLLQKYEVKIIEAD